VLLPAINPPLHPAFWLRETMMGFTKADWQAWSDNGGNMTAEQLADAALCAAGDTRKVCPPLWILRHLRRKRRRRLDVGCIVVCEPPSIHLSPPPTSSFRAIISPVAMRVAIGTGNPVITFRPDRSSSARSDRCQRDGDISPFYSISLRAKSPAWQRRLPDTLP
jgi:hypothetical protein